MEKPSIVAAPCTKPEPSAFDKALTLFKHQAPVMLFNIVLPLVIYKLAKPYTSEIVAVFLSGVVPMVKTLVTFVWFRRQDAISVMQIVGVLITITITLFSTDAKTLLLFQVGVGGLYGIFTILSVYLLEEDLFYQIRRTLSTKTTEELDLHYQKPVVRETSRFLTVIMGAVTVVSSTISVIMVLSLSVDTVMYINNLLPFMNIPIIYWMYRYVNDKEAADEWTPLVKPAAVESTVSVVVVK